jgi:hypothetical protein
VDPIVTTHEYTRISSSSVYVLPTAAASNASPVLATIIGNVPTAAKVIALVDESRLSHSKYVLASAAGSDIYPINGAPVRRCPAVSKVTAVINISTVYYSINELPAAAGADTSPFTILLEGNFPC